MRTEDLNYNLPDELIAQKPVEHRSESRLMVLETNSKAIIDTRFDRISGHIHPGDCFVINDTKVVPARFFARRKTGANLEGLYLSTIGKNTWEIMLKGARKVKAGEELVLLPKEGGGYFRARLVDKMEEGKCLIEVLSPEAAEDILEAIGFPPLPPYIKRDSDPETAESDRQRYQTVYAEKNGAVAAPTAGLHFTDELIEELKGKGVKFARVTLHVGAGTFKPVTAENLKDHEIHSETYEVDSENADIINEARRKGGRIIAVGTTSVRTLETAAGEGQISASSGDTRLFIMPGYEFKMVDAMITNFHLPKSTLLALVGAFAGMDLIKMAYEHAVEKRYRFFSYGDAMFINKA